MASTGLHATLHAAEALMARPDLSSPALGTMAAFEGVPAPQVTDNALLTTDANLLATNHDISDFEVDPKPTVQLGEVEVEKATMPSTAEWPPPNQQNMSYFKLYR